MLEDLRRDRFSLGGSDAVSFITFARASLVGELVVRPGGFAHSARPEQEETLLRGVPGVIADT